MTSQIPPPYYYPIQDQIQPIPIEFDFSQWDVATRCAAQVHASTSHTCYNSVREPTSPRRSAFLESAMVVRWDSEGGRVTQFYGHSRSLFEHFGD